MVGNPIEAFRTHRNYLVAFRTLLEQYAKPSMFVLSVPLDDIYGALVNPIRASSTFAKSQLKPGLNNAAVASHLRNAWTTELLLGLTGQTVDDDLMGMANNWGAVQAYYACYHAYQAFNFCSGEAVLDSHEKTRSAFENYWAARNMLLPPWTFAWGNGAPRNGKPGHGFADVHTWSNCDWTNCWDFAAKALRKTREDWIEKRLASERGVKVKKRRQKWEAEEALRVAGGKSSRVKPAFVTAQLSAAEKASIEQSVRPATMLDYLYRLRERCNYKDATMFIDGPEYPGHSSEINRTFRTIVGATMLVHEAHILRRIGQPTFENIVKQWRDAVGLTLEGIGLLSRRDYLEAIAK